MRWYERVIDGLTAVTPIAVFHGEAAKSDRYIVWRETGRNDFWTGNGRAEMAMEGFIRLYSKTEFDPWSDAILKSLPTAGVRVALMSVEFDSETKYWVWEYEWEVRDG